MASYQPHAAGDSDASTKGVRAIAAVVGIVFLLVGIPGFVPGITTTHYGDLSFAGHHSRAELLGIFQVSVLHNIVHLLFGVAGLALSRTARTAVAYLIGGCSSISCCGSTASRSAKAARRTSCRSTVPTTGCTWCWASAWSAWD